ncbi:MAG: 50S ribosomal protein L30 [Candidatus Limnocylindria bacterium]
MTELEITQKRSAIGEKEAAHGTLRALGLGRPGQTVHHEDGPQVRGMLRRVAHLVQVKEPALSRGERAPGLAGPSEPKKSGAV